MTMLVTQSVQIRGLTAEQYEILRYQCRLASALDLDNLPEYNADNPQTYDFQGRELKGVCIGLRMKN
ncbi:hypothetical protein CWATWH0005_3608 [Crocosphaera watsonii WH 0005]|uniref:Uncharacterized protein n=2 Tax=Crocosphaera watsonii TaxID=263511 RepID=T2IMP6_CROWT|nr:hypothetical protein CWATWH0005_3608 [Crocosphaera watsonii WH 0005]